MPAGRGSFLTPVLAIVRRPPSPKICDPSALSKLALGRWVRGPWPRTIRIAELTFPAPVLGPPNAAPAPKVGVHNDRAQLWR